MNINSTNFRFFTLRVFRKSLKTYSSIFLALPLAISLLACKTSDLNRISQTLQQTQQPLDNKTVVAGLKQALEVSTDNSVKRSSKQGGFSDNPHIRILIPQELHKVESSLKKIGLGRYVDRFEIQMNRSAESASKEAKKIFIHSITQMTFSDAWKILRGKDDEATQYFKRTTSAHLTNKFKPIIKHSMKKVGFYKDYRKLLKTYQSIPFTRKPDLDIENYILQKTLDGLFTLLAQEERKIRHAPAARVTELLRQVFGSQH